MLMAIDAVIWLLNVTVIAWLLVRSTGDDGPATWSAVALATVVIVGIPVNWYRHYRIARRIIKARQTVR
jgi:hypothetical protein